MGLYKTNVSNYTNFNLVLYSFSVSLYILDMWILLIFSDDALTASYLKLKVASNEKQSVDTVDTGVQADYLAVAPG